MADLTRLSGYPLVRFQVAFELDREPGAFPYGADSLRPQVGRVRLRARY